MVAWKAINISLSDWTTSLAEMALIQAAVSLRRTRFHLKLIPSQKTVGVAESGNSLLQNVSRIVQMYALDRRIFGSY